MFVQSNSVEAIKKYFKERLAYRFSESEIKSISKQSVMERLNISSTDYLLGDKLLLSESDLLYFRSIVKRLQNNEPFQYVIGNCDFFGLKFKCDKRALIPRPETEELVHWIESVYSKDEELVIHDVCCGSGCIGLSLKSVFPKSNVLLSDYEDDALELTKENAKLLNLHVEVQKLNALSDNTSFDNKFDVWVSNPPYIPENEKSEMKQHVLEFEPHSALFVPDEDALIFYKQISKNAFKSLKDGGRVFFELHENLFQKSEEVLRETGFINIELRKDLQGKNRMLMGQKP